MAAYLTGYDRLLFVGQNIDLAAAGAMAGVWSRTLGVPVETVPAAELRHTLLPTVDSHTALVALISSRELTEKPALPCNWRPFGARVRWLAR